MSVFDFATYPLSSDTSFTHRHHVTRDLMDDGTPHVRVMGDSGYQETMLRFQPMSIAESSALISYLSANVATEFDFGDFGTGYIWGDPTVEVVSGPLRAVSVLIYSRVT